MNERDVTFIFVFIFMVGLIGSGITLVSILLFEEKTLSSDWEKYRKKMKEIDELIAKIRTQSEVLKVLLRTGEGETITK